MLIAFVVGLTNLYWYFAKMIVSIDTTRGTTSATPATVRYASGVPAFQRSVITYPPPPPSSPILDISIHIVIRLVKNPNFHVVTAFHVLYLMSGMSAWHAVAAEEGVLYVVRDSNSALNCYPLFFIYNYPNFVESGLIHTRALPIYYQ